MSSITRSVQNDPITTITVDGTTVSTLAISSAAITAADVGALPATARSVRVYASSTGQSLTSGSIQAVDISTTEYNDSTSMYVVDLPGNSITVNNSGLYLASWSLKYTGGTQPGQRVALIRKNFTTVIREAQKQVTTTSTDSVRGSDVLRLTGGDTLELGAYVDGGTSVSVVSDIAAATGLSLAYLGA